MEMTVGNLYICPDECIVMYLKDNPEHSNMFYGISMIAFDKRYPLKGHFCKNYHKEAFQPYNEPLTIQNGKN